MPIPFRSWIPQKRSWIFSHKPQKKAATLLAGMEVPVSHWNPFCHFPDPGLSGPVFTGKTYRGRYECLLPAGSFSYRTYGNPGFYSMYIALSGRCETKTEHRNRAAICLVFENGRNEIYPVICGRQTPCLGNFLISDHRGFSWTVWKYICGTFPAISESGGLSGNPVPDLRWKKHLESDPVDGRGGAGGRRDHFPLDGLSEDAG